MTEVAHDPGDDLDDSDDPLIGSIRRLARRVQLAEDIIRRLQIVVRVLGVLVVAFVLMLAALGLTAWANHSNGCTFRTKHNLLVDKIEDGARNIVPAGATPQQRQSIEAYVATIEAARVIGC